MRYQFVDCRCDDVAVLDGGISAWKGPLRAGEEGIEPGTFERRPRAGDLVSASELAARLGDERLSIVDAREPARYHGAIVIHPVGGRIPGAVNVPHFDPEPPEEVLAADEIVVYCGSPIERD